MAPAPRCPDGSHNLPPTARPGTVTKCRDCRASVRIPKDDAGAAPRPPQDRPGPRREADPLMWEIGFKCGKHWTPQKWQAIVQSGDPEPLCPKCRRTGTDIVPEEAELRELGYFPVGETPPAPEPEPDAEPEPEPESGPRVTGLAAILPRVALSTAILPDIDSPIRAQLATERRQRQEVAGHITAARRQQGLIEQSQRTRQQRDCDNGVHSQVDTEPGTLKITCLGCGEVLRKGMQ